MQWAEGGSLDDFIDMRAANANPDVSPDDHDPDSRTGRIRAFRAFQRATPSERTQFRNRMSNNKASWTAVHLLSAAEVRSLFGDVADGLGFLVRSLTGIYSGC
jgi:hypothetical protein